MPEHPAAELYLLDAVSRAQRALLRVSRTRDVPDVLVRLVTELGGRVVSADEPGPAIIPLDLTLGDREPVVAAAEPGSLARDQLDRVLVEVVEDAHHVVELLRAVEEVRADGEVDLLTGALTEHALARVLERCGPGDAAVAFGFADSDRLVPALGRARADALLGELAGVLRDLVHPAERVGRLDAWALAAVLPRSGDVEARELAKRVEAAWYDDDAARSAPLRWAVVLVDSPEGAGPRALADLRGALEHQPERGTIGR